MSKSLLTVLAALAALNANASCYMLHAPGGERLYQSTTPPFDVSLHSPALEAARARGQHLVIGDDDACQVYAVEVPLQTLPPLPLAALSALGGGAVGGYGGSAVGGYGGDGAHEVAQEIRRLRQQQQFQADQAAIMAPFHRGPSWYDTWRTNNALDSIHQDLSQMRTDRIIYGHGW